MQYITDNPGTTPRQISADVFRQYSEKGISRTTQILRRLAETGRVIKDATRRPATWTVRGERSSDPETMLRRCLPHIAALAELDIGYADYDRVLVQLLRDLHAAGYDARSSRVSKCGAHGFLQLADGIESWADTTSPPVACEHDIGSGEPMTLQGASDGAALCSDGGR
jgi:hypothetical protein